MKNYKHILVAISIFGLAFAIPFLSIKSDAPYIIILLVFFILLFHFTARNSIFFKPYFLSRWNIFTSKFRDEINIEWPKELMFDKLLEVISESPFKLKYADRETFKILITSPISWLSWGENIYIDLKNVDGQTNIHFDSVAFQMYSWGKNEKNHAIFFKNLEDSLTV